MVGGVAQAGDVAVMSALKPGDYEVIASGDGCFEKAIDVTAPRLPKGNETLAEVSRVLPTRCERLAAIIRPPAAAVLTVPEYLELPESAGAGRERAAGYRRSTSV